MHEEVMAGGMEFLKWLRILGRGRATGYRWVSRGWIEPTNIAGKLYVTVEEINRFWTRAKAGEFARGAGGICAAPQEPDGEEGDGSKD